MSRPYTFLLLLCLFFVTASCRSKTANKTFVNYRDSVTNKKQWKLVKLDTEVFYQPLDWKAGKQPGSSYFAYLNNGDKGRCFNIIKCKMPGAEPIAYLRELYKAQLKDKTEIFDGYDVKKQVIGKNEIYSCQFFLSAGKNKLLNYSIIFTDNDYLYNVSVKIERQDYSQYKCRLENIVYNLRIKDRYVFDPDVNIASERVIDLSKL